MNGVEVQVTMVSTSGIAGWFAKLMNGAMKRAIFLSVLAALMASACVSHTLGQPTGPEEEEEDPTNLFLYVSNQSYYLGPVDIRVHIDGEVVVDDLFYVMDYHNWEVFKLVLEVGRHSLYVESETGDATLQEEFTVVTKHSMLIGFYSDEPYGIPGHFGFAIQDGGPLGLY